MEAVATGRAALWKYLLEENSATSVSLWGVRASVGGGGGMSYLCPALRGWGHSWVKWRRLSDEEELAAKEKNPALF